ncbi:MAG: precorrin-3B C(17)-methyltransferase [Desulfobacca sp.]|nr:precorrin-3B C(17)-methyltransferase [Desulfobacca sp.]
MSLGPGAAEYLAPKAREALEAAQVVVGYQTYIDLIAPLLTHQEVVATGMRAEVQRCQSAIDRARSGQRVALVSSGDSGIYGMAGLVLELCAAQGLRLGQAKTDRDADLSLEVIPGIPALAAGAALLGAPLMHDFAVISLSDLLTPWEVIQRRVEAAAQGDFVIVLYNPKSQKRDWQLPRVVELLLRHKEPHTPVGLVRRASRAGETIVVTTLENILEQPVDMQAIIMVGNSQSFRYGPYLVTPRGYLGKYQVPEKE